jgi:CRISPR-associated endonuclease/helicase Cas3
MNHKKFYAHSRNDNGAGKPDPLQVHLSEVRNNASYYARVFGAAPLADIAGLLHDLGKYACQFQRRLENPSEETARDHSIAGAAAILGCYKRQGEMAALVIEGHHLGLKQIRTDTNGSPAWEAWLRQIASDLSKHPDAFTETKLSLLLERFRKDGGAFPELAKPDFPNLLHDECASAAAMLDVRMLFSALVDADFLDTEAHFNGKAEQPRIRRPEGPRLMIDECLKRLDEYLPEVRSESAANGGIQALRDELMRSCIRAATKTQGLFTLTAPTGAGKTLAMLAFALHHAKKWELRRIILVLPYLNIIEQTAKTYNALFGVDKGFPESFVLEDHSLAHRRSDPSEEDNESESTRVARLLAENWDAPIILTTSVKCLESLMHNKSAPCRKLHQVAKSIILFDEVQTLPPKLVAPTLATLSRLADPNGPYGCSVVFSTATQPAFDHLHTNVHRINPFGWQPKEIVANHEEMFQVASERTQIHWRHEKVIRMEDLAQEILEHESNRVLCIVNLKRHAAKLAKTLKDTDMDGLYHLSTNMCAAHRREVLDEIQTRLENQKPVRLVATQCVEAGVDLDFPVVYRALAPLDALAQAAGRCNRHGGQSEKGIVNIIRIEKDGPSEFPPGYKEGVEQTKIFLNRLTEERVQLNELNVFNNPELLRRYYQQLYDLTGRGSGQREDEEELINAIRAGDFVRVARAYHLIDQDAINILVPYDRTVFRKLVEQMESNQPRNLKMIRRWIAAARPYTVSLYRPKRDDSAWCHLAPICFSLKEEPDNATHNWFYTLPDAKYEKLTGLEFHEKWVV